MNGKVSVVFNRNYFPKMKDFSRLGHLAGSHVHRKDIVQDRHVVTTRDVSNWKYHMVYRFVPFLVTLNDLKGHSSVAGLIKCNSTNICATFRTVSTGTARRAVPRR